MAVSLLKGKKISLTKEYPGLTKVAIGLGWDVNKFDSKFEHDLDASVFLLGANGKCRDDKDIIYYLQPDAPGVHHTGDNRTGGAEGEDERIIVDLDKVPANVEKLIIVVTIHEADKRGQNFGQVQNAFARLVNEETGEEVLRYDLREDFSDQTAVEFCEIYRYNGEWKFGAIGAGYNGGLAAMVVQYGLEVE